MMSYINETDFVIENKELVYPEIITDGLQLYYDAKGKRDTDYHRDTMLDMSGNKNHGKLHNFAYEKHSGYKDGLVFDYIDDKLVRPELDLKPNDFTFMLNGNIISFSSDGTVKRVQDGEVIESKGFNLVRNGDFVDGTKGWMNTPGYLNRFDVIGNTAVNREISTNKHRSFVYNSLSIPEGNIVYSNFRFKQNNITKSLMSILYSISGANMVARYQITGNDFEVYSATGPYGSSSIFRLLIGDIETNENPEIYLDYLMLIDLTETFGAGNEPTKEQMDEIVNRFGFIPNAQDLIDRIEYKGNDLGDMENIIDGLYKTEVLSGEEIYTDKADDAVVHVEVDGKSVGGGSGKNLFAPKKEWESKVFDGYECWQLNNVTQTEGFKPNTQYTITATAKYVAGYAVRLRFDYTDGTFDSTPWYGMSFVTQTLKSNIAKDVKSLTFQQNIASQTVYSGAWVKDSIQLEEGSTVTAYEPPVPSPEYPIEINHMAKNLLALSEEVIAGQYIYESDGTFKTSSAHDLFKFFPVNPNIEYVIKGINGYKIRQARVAFYDKNRIFISGQLFQTDSAQNAKIISPPNAVFGCYSSGDLNTPYKYQYLGSTGTDIDVVSSVGKENLLPNSLEAALSFNNHGGVNTQYREGSIQIMNVGAGRGLSTYNNSNYFDFSKLIDGEVYTYSYMVNPSIDSNMYIDWKNAQNAVLVKANVWTQISYTQKYDANTTNSYLMGVAASHNASATTYKLTKPKIEKGNKATPWCPAISDVGNEPDISTLDKINILLDEPLRSVEDIKDRLFRDSDGLWKIERNIGETIVDHTNGILIGSSGSGWKVDGNTVPFYGYGEPSSNNQPSLTDKFKTSIGSGIVSADSELFSTGYIGYYAFRINKDRLDTVDVAGFKKWLEVNPVKVLYVLQTPIIETLDQELQDKLNNLRSFEDSNYVYTVLQNENNTLSEKMKPTLHAKFLYNNWYKEDRVINNLMIYNRALTNEEMLQNYKTIKRRWRM